MAILIRGKLYSNWKEAESKSSIFRSEQKKFQFDLDQDACSNADEVIDRYHLIAGYGDPWSHRVLITRVLKKLGAFIPVTIVDPMPTNQGWKLRKDDEAVNDVMSNYSYLYELYRQSDFLYTGRLTVPLIWDSLKKKIINNESHEIMQILNKDFLWVHENTDDLFPASMVDELDCLYDFIFDSVNNGVYKTGFAPNQRIYEKSIAALFAALDELEEHLSYSRFLMGDNITGVDICLFTTLIRFDAVYYPYMKCNHKQLQEYKNLWAYTKDIYHLPGVKDTVCFESMMKTYYGLEYLNPTKVIPSVPKLELGTGIETLNYELYSAPF